MKVFLSIALLAAVAVAEPPSYRQRQQQQQQQRYYIARQEEEPTTAVPASAPYPASGWRPDGPAFELPQRQQQASEVDSTYGAPTASAPQQQYGAPEQQYGAPSPAADTQTFARQPKQLRGPQLAAMRQYGAPEFGRTEVPEAEGTTVGGLPQRYQAAQGQRFGALQQQPQFALSRQYGAPEFTTEQPVEDEATTVVGLPEAESQQVRAAQELVDDDEFEGQGQQQQQQEQGEYYVALPDGRLQRVRYVSRQDLEAMRTFAKIRAENVEPLRGPIYAYSPLQKLEVAPANLEVVAEPGLVQTGLTGRAAGAKPQRLVSPKLEVTKPLAQVQYQHDNPAAVLPVSSSFSTYTANYQVPVAPVAPVEDRYILALP